jgi:hypothetical protein
MDVRGEARGRNEALAGDIVVSQRMTEQRILEVLLLMAEAGAAPLRPDIKNCSFSEAVLLLRTCRALDSP